MNAQGIERLEMLGDWYEEMRIEDEREEAFRDAPVHEDTDEDVEAHSSTGATATLRSWCGTGKTRTVRRSGNSFDRSNFEGILVT